MYACVRTKPTKSVLLGLRPSIRNKKNTENQNSCVKPLTLLRVRHAGRLLITGDPPQISADNVVQLGLGPRSTLDPLRVGKYDAVWFLGVWCNAVHITVPTELHPVLLRYGLRTASIFRSLAESSHALQTCASLSN